MNVLYRTRLILLLAFAATTFVELPAQTLKDAIALQFNNPDSAILLTKNILPTLKADSAALSNAYEIIGISNWVKGNLSQAYGWHKKSLDLRSAIKFVSGVAHSNNNLGLIYWKMGNRLKALEYYQLSLDAAESVSDSMVISNVLANIGILYKEQGDLDNALQFYERSLAILKSGFNLRSWANTLNNTAIIYRERNDAEMARTYWYQCLDLYRKQDDKRGEALILNNLGLVYSDKNELTKADSLFELALSTYRQLDDTHGLAMVLGNLGANAKSDGELERAISLCTESYDLAHEIQAADFMKSACKCLAEAQQLSGNNQEAVKFLWQYIQLSDSLYHIENNRQVSLVQLRYEHDKEVLKSALERERERATAEAEISRQQLLRNASIIIGLLALVMLFVLYKSYQRKQRANLLLQARNTEIFRQRQEIAVKSKEVTESITYAKRLQDARLPNPELFSNHFASWHVFFRPKDIVSGDFYWLEFVDGLRYIAVADCTGHGVPGAMVSMVGIQALNEALLDKGLRKPGEILDDVNKHVASAFVKSGNSMTDGMDIALVCIDSEKKLLHYAGAFNPLLILSQQEIMLGAELKLAGENIFIHELKANRQSIGNLNISEAFTTKTVEILGSETLVLFSDGFADQFGGELNKKYGVRQLRNMILEANNQNNWYMLNREFDKWKGDKFQVDDVALVVVSLQ
jgi:tetratricopeptide (TPR) repeat protein/serine phosphatase RsbU (regulator of sigma subunit)